MVQCIRWRFVGHVLPISDPARPPPPLGSSTSVLLGCVFPIDDLTLCGCGFISCCPSPNAFILPFSGSIIPADEVAVCARVCPKMGKAKSKDCKFVGAADFFRLCSSATTLQVRLSFAPAPAEPAAGSFSRSYAETMSTAQRGDRSSASKPWEMQQYLQQRPGYGSNSQLSDDGSDA
ncbi:uncharacterized protein LOC110434049 isoform X2 [Sorghum bicolor]|uniref:uncharacterized protein LOC110434049 isoform X2 n=1 Tax=Sorghum bicolor TaxID=4558 RepID=UPI000B423BCF|nr:uncharacterized protein LOC110434049 isoform X2 [Sorghum bicolor]|eukprot:XP_021313366.1 uncharacterized protein LOC110434049 isoform X2 [Sorghum bicolor]